LSAVAGVAFRNTVRAHCLARRGHVHRPGRGRSGPPGRSAVLPGRFHPSVPETLRAGGALPRPPACSASTLPRCPIAAGAQAGVAAPEPRPALPHPSPANSDDIAAQRTSLPGEIIRTRMDGAASGRVARRASSCGRLACGRRRRCHVGRRGLVFRWCSRPRCLSLVVICDPGPGRAALPSDGSGAPATEMGNGPRVPGGKSLQVPSGANRSGGPMNLADPAGGGVYGQRVGRGGRLSRGLVACVGGRCGWHGLGGGRMGRGLVG
jgi:hypothetical protein